MSQITIPPLPEGWSGTPDDLIIWINENGVLDTSGNNPGGAITGQVGGTTPTEDVGIWFSDNSIEKFINGRYQPITDTPIGAGFPWFGVFTTVPANYLEMDGRSLLRADYPDLYAVLGILWGNDSDDTFNLPDARGRVPIGAGKGDYSLNQLDGLAGDMADRAVGDYFGQDWIRKENKPPGFPSGAAVKSFLNSTLIEGSNHYGAVYQPAFSSNWIIRYR